MNKNERETKLLEDLFLIDRRILTFSLAVNKALPALLEYKKEVMETLRETVMKVITENPGHATKVVYAVDTAMKEMEIFPFLQLVEIPEPDKDGACPSRCPLYHCQDDYGQECKEEFEDSCETESGQIRPGPECKRYPGKDKK